MQVWGKRVLLAGIAVVVLVQFIPVTVANPPVDPVQAISASVNVPSEVAGILTRACQDCDSNQTTSPWYSRIAPVSWLVACDVSEGRWGLSFSEWGRYNRYNPRRQDRKLKEICEQVERRKMPMPISTVMHPDAKLTASDRKALCDWSGAEGPSRRHNGVNSLASCPRDTPHTSGPQCRSEAAAPEPSIGG